MRFTIPQKALASLEQRGGAVVQRQAALSALTHFRITADADNQTLSLASSDMDRFAEATVAANIDEGGTVLVQGATFSTLVKKHQKGADITIESGDAFITIKAGRSKVRIPTLDADKFPAWADEVPAASFDMAGEDFERALTRVRFAASDSEAVWHLNGVCMDATPGDALHFVATDSYRFSLSGVAMPEGAKTCPRVTIPSGSVDAALRVFKGAATVHVAATERAVSFSADGLRLSGRLIDSKFPDYQRIIPARGGNPTITFSRADFVDCLDRANVLTGEGTAAAITLEAGEGGLLLRAKNQNGGSADEGLPGDVEGEFLPFKFNPRFAASFLATLNVGTLSIEQSNQAGAHVITSQDAPDFLGLLMPIGK